MAGLQAPLSTLRLASRDALRMTRGQRGLLFLYCCGLSPFTLCAVSRRTNGLQGPVLGIFPAATYLNSYGTASANDLVVLFTDGLFEVETADDE